MANVLVTGAAGMLGCTLVPYLRQSGHAVATHSHSSAAMHQADLSCPFEARRLLDLVEPDIVVNLVGLTDVERCQTEPDAAYRANVRPVENLAAWIKSARRPCHLVQISTDQVYDGPGPHLEGEVALTNIYAFSKFAGELAAACPSTILRTNFFGLSHCGRRASLTDWLARGLAVGEEMQVFDDVLFSPLSMETLSWAIEFALREKPFGVFNLGSRGGMSKADFAFTFAEELGLPTRLMARTTTENARFLKTYRPKDMRMDCNKFEASLGIKLGLLSDEIKLAAREYREQT